MKIAFFPTAVCVWLALTFPALGQEKTPSPVVVKIDDLAWLAGSWHSQRDGVSTEEQWMAPNGGMMLGMNRTVSRSGKSSFEFLRIAQSNGGLTYFASPGGKPATPFKLKELRDRSATFENLENDFPQRIIYRRESDVLHARIEGAIHGKSQSMEWRWTAKDVAPSK